MTITVSQLAGIVAGGDRRILASIAKRQESA